VVLVDDQLFYCTICEHRGGVVQFIEQYYAVDYVTAVGILVGDIEPPPRAPVSEAVAADLNDDETEIEPVTSPGDHEKTPDDISSVSAPSRPVKPTPITCWRGNDGRCADLIYDRTTHIGRLVVHGHSDSVDVVASLRTDDGKILAPLTNVVIANSWCRVPTHFSDPEPVERLALDIHDWLRHVVDLSYPGYHLAVCYILLTWIYDTLSSIPYLRILGPAGSGKGRFIETVGQICYHPVVIGADPTPADLLRLPGLYHCTLCIDEGASISGEEQSKVTSIINSGYRRDKPAWRSRREGDPYEIIPYDIFCPKIIACRLRYEDAGLERRMLTIHTLPTMRRDIPRQPQPQWQERIDNFQSRLLRYRIDRSRDRGGLSNLDTASFSPAVEEVILPLLHVAPTGEYRGALLHAAELMEEGLRLHRRLSVEATVAQAISRLYQPGNRMYIGEITEEVNRLRGDASSPNRLRPEIIGRLLAGEMAVRSRHSKDGNFLELSQDELDALCRRYLGADY
jgi:hypothetical protein